MKRLKSLFLALSLALSINIILTKRADASLIVGTINPAAGVTIFAIGTAANFFVLPILAVADVIELNDNSAWFFWGVTVLDEEVNSISLMLESNFPMINDLSIFDEFSSMIQLQLDQNIDNPKAFEVKLKESEIRSVLERIDIYGIEDEIEKLVNTLT
jgi:hypothetical protein